MFKKKKRTGKLSSLCKKNSLVLYSNSLSRFFPSNNSLYSTRPRGKSFPREGHSAVPPRGLTIFWCIYSRLAKRLTGFKLYALSANKCQHCCGSMQMDATSHNIVGPNNVACCWPTMLTCVRLHGAIAIVS